jgi:hypothetical protein
MKRTILAMAVTAVSMATYGCGASAQVAQFSLQMRPVPPLSAKACIAEARHYGYSSGAGSIICAPGQHRGWYHAVLTNRGAYGLPSCVATGFGAQGQKVFAGPLFFEIGGIRGMFVPAHRSVTFYWYLPAKARGPVARYATSCALVTNPPV